MITEAIASGTYARFEGITNFASVRATNATITPVRAAVSSYHTNFVVGLLISPMYFIERKNSFTGFFSSIPTSCKTALDALITAQASNIMLHIKAIAMAL